MAERLKLTFQQHHKRWFLLLALIIILLILSRVVFLTLFTHKRVIEPASVAVATVTTQNVPVYFSALGTVSAVNTITVKTQIAGILINSYFKDGQYVKTGDVLGEIDPRPYQAVLMQNEGQLARDQALLANAQVDLKRYINLYKTHAVSQQTLDTQQALVKQDAGTVVSDKGLVDAAKTNLLYCNIISPITGRIGISTISSGNFVQPSDTNGIAVITTLDPIEILFYLPQDDVSVIEKEFNAGKILTVNAYDRDAHALIASGNLYAIDNQVNVATGTVKFEALLDNKNNILFPNEFVNVNLQVTTLKNALIVPTSAIQQGANGSYVYRLNQNQTVSNIAVKTSVNYGEFTVVTTGLSENQIVVTEGSDKLFDGAKVFIPGKTKKSKT